MQVLLRDMETRMQAAVDLVGRELAGLRTGRANTALLDALRVDAYGSPTPINQLASVAVPDPKTLVIQPWDASQIGVIEKAILKSDLGLTPASDGKVIRLTMPALTEERRRQLAKTVGKFAEEGRVAVRNVRREINDKLKALAKEKHVAQDEERRGHEQIQKTTDRFIARIDELAKKKEHELLSM
ncbi:MAG: ribosome recycling factor [Candidatus Rokubacteria bacterium]|nr:ribosome recycling factor [Candidatus Rokubacteria bacterium]